MAPYSNQIKYVIDFLNGHPLTPVGLSLIEDATESDDSFFCIRYGNEKQPYEAGVIHMPAQQVIFSDLVYPSLHLAANSYDFESMTIWSVEEQKKEHRTFFEANAFGFDCFEAIFFHLSRYEEYHATQNQKDWNEELPSKDHFLVQNRIHEMPVIDHLVYAFWRSLGFNPDKQATTFELSHDIDVLQKYPNKRKSIRAIASALKHQKSLAAALKVAYNWYAVTRKHSQDPYDTFDWLLSEIEMPKKVFFMTGGTTKFDNLYDFNNPKVDQIIKQSQEKGYEVGLHPSYNCLRNQAMMQAEKHHLEQKLGKTVKSLRMHYLRYDFKQTTSIIENLGFESDGTFGYQDCIGFRCGTGFSYHPYNFSTHRAASFLETPMVIMDVGLLRSCGFDVPKCRLDLNEFLSKNTRFTHISINVHNSIFDPATVTVNAFQDLYLNLLEHISSLDF